VAVGHPFDQLDQPNRLQGATDPPPRHVEIGVAGALSCTP
jgi:hypothetical protein